MSAHDHIVITSHPSGADKTQPAIKWGAADPAERGPVIGTVTDPAMRNTIGTHSGSYSVYLAASVAAGTWIQIFVPIFTIRCQSLRLAPPAVVGRGKDRIAGSLRPHDHRMFQRTTRCRHQYPSYHCNHPSKTADARVA